MAEVARHSGRGMPRLRSVNLLGLGTAVVFIALWEAVIDLLPHSVLPDVPSSVDIIRAVPGVVGTVTFWEAAWHTVWVTLVGWLIASAIGGLIGLACGLSGLVRRWSTSSIDVLRALPAVTFIPIGILVFGQSAKMELIIVAYSACWIVAISATVGFRDSHERYRDTGRTLRLNPFALVWKIVLPGAVPHLIVGLRLALATALVLTVVAEMIGNPAGLGYQLSFLLQALRTADVFVYIVAIGILGLLFNGVLLLVARLVPASAQGGQSGEAR